MVTTSTVFLASSPSSSCSLDLSDFDDSSTSASPPFRASAGRVPAEDSLERRSGGSNGGSPVQGEDAYLRHFRVGSAYSRPSCDVLKAGRVARLVGASILAVACCVLAAKLIVGKLSALADASTTDVPDDGRDTGVALFPQDSSLFSFDTNGRPYGYTGSERPTSTAERRPGNQLFLTLPVNKLSRRNDTLEGNNVLEVGAVNKRPYGPLVPDSNESTNKPQVISGRTRRVRSPDIAISAGNPLRLAGANSRNTVPTSGTSKPSDLPSDTISDRVSSEWPSDQGPTKPSTKTRRAVVDLEPPELPQRDSLHMLPH
ncbi:hypothetical protein V5799_020362 [Amblyomma americanum]|uniref:Uncharacterized protein n=1 Tax=Amblyomma americanum TaxID=6943 RepID=A0AAQ4EU18_AMBAM